MTLLNALFSTPPPPPPLPTNYDFLLSSDYLPSMHTSVDGSLFLFGKPCSSTDASFSITGCVQKSLQFVRNQAVEDRNIPLQYCMELGFLGTTLLGSIEIIVRATLHLIALTCAYGLYPMYLHEEINALPIAISTTAVVYTALSTLQAAVSLYTNFTEHGEKIAYDAQLTAIDTAIPLSHYATSVWTNSLLKLLNVPAGGAEIPDPLEASNKFYWSISDVVQEEVEKAHNEVFKEEFLRDVTLLDAIQLLGPQFGFMGVMFLGAIETTVRTMLFTANMLPFLALLTIPNIDLEVTIAPSLFMMGGIKRSALDVAESAVSFCTNFQYPREINYKWQKEAWFGYKETYF